jgi:P-type Cu2+ transporter
MPPLDDSGGRIADDAACLHCGAVLPAGSRFCCTGCEGAYEAVKGLGLEAFYARRTAPSARPETDGVIHDYATRVNVAPDGVATLHLMVDGITCAACVWLIESLYAREKDVLDARVNLSTGRLVLKWRGDAARADTLVALAAKLGFRLVPFDPSCLTRAGDAEERDLLRATGVAGFAAGNVMMLSLAVWVGTDMGPATKDLLHWVSALIGLPCIFYAGLPFYRSALGALRARRLNMDVPIAVGITMTAAMSLSETLRSGPYAYFDAALTLLFFLLAGRYLDRRARGRARATAEHLLALRAAPVTIIDAEGRARAVPVDAVKKGDFVQVAAGERIGVDGTILAGVTDLDTSLVTGESLPRAAKPGDGVFAGMINLGAPLRVRATATGENTLLAEIVRLVEAAEGGRSRFVAISERVTRLYAPVVHVTALATFLGWFFLAGVDWQVALLYAVATLIITCPCALGLAVPSVQVVASGRLLKGGVLLKNATALERLAEIDTIVFDKTGTLTQGKPVLIDDPLRDKDDQRFAASMAAASRHPLARALAGTMRDVAIASGVDEHPGQGLTLAGAKLGSRAFLRIDDAIVGPAEGPELWLDRGDGRKVRFAFEDAPRDDAAATIERLAAQGYAIELLSGDRRETVRAMAETLGIAEWRAEANPAAKAARLAELAASGREVLMVGDGLNDAPALAAAHASLSPATGADIAQVAADAVFQGAGLSAVGELLDVASRARVLVRQNIAASIVYNALAVPAAVLGFVTPPLAAFLMSSSSVAVVVNSLRLGRSRWTRS